MAQLTASSITVYEMSLSSEYAAKATSTSHLTVEGKVRSYEAIEARGRVLSLSSRWTGMGWDVQAVSVGAGSEPATWPV
jgi:hypothetical protein